MTPTYETKPFAKRQLLTYIALFVLLGLRFPIADFVSNFLQLLQITIAPSWVNELRIINYWTFYFWEKASLIIVGLIIIVNRFDLKDLNIDKYFIIVFVISSVIYCAYFFWPSGWIAAIMAIILLILSARKEYRFVTETRKFSRITILIVITFFLGLLLTRDSLSVAKISETVRYLIPRIPFTMVEEVIFRGLFWMFLRNLNISESKIVVLQAILFWLFHAYLMFSDPMFFWITTLVASILLGIIVWCFKSITPSTIAHILFNLWLWQR